MSRRANSCPLCNQQIEFYGIAHYRVRGIPFPVKVKWYECTSCRMVHAQNFTGRIVHSRKPFTLDENKSLFPSQHEKRDRRGPRKEAAANA